MANVIVNDIGAIRGIRQDETGCNIDTITVTFRPHVKAKLEGKDGSPITFAVSSLPDREVTIQGEITSLAGVSAPSFITAYIFANKVDTYGGAGGFYQDEGSTTENRNGWWSLNSKYSADPNIP